MTEQTDKFRKRMHLSDEHKAKISLAITGKKRTDETKKKMSEAQLSSPKVKASREAYWKAYRERKSNTDAIDKIRPDIDEVIIPDGMYKGKAIK